ncbi:MULTISPECIES: substrate import-associated zinc metallohydrolase lipoprotein [Sphingobacterium]|uniref:substrate import-associated zinc metallohydrolase lipoprotein n=1 Tax=Sphingobacterium TaxID=28453 RepID=UPI00257D2C67|nr:MULTISPECIES: substrate import-associated zinc metallohydrolase lipoprotein [Sphingobacterium]
MKRFFNYMICVFALGSLLSCSKDNDNLTVDLTKYNPDITAQNDVDKWLTSNLVNPYNIETVYRFERNFTDVNRDISPVALGQVEPMMNAVLTTYLQPYEKIGGKTFIKKYTPKQFVLYGSPSYNTNGSITLGTADNGRRIVLYELNSLDFNNPAAVKRPVRTIHHEFTHILNQNIVIPPAFEQISKADYTADWTGAANTPALAKSLGFVSQYSRSSFGEDFAEMNAHLLVEGQVWFDNYCATTSPSAAAKLREKEKLVVSYFKDYYNIDYRALQAEVQRVLKEGYGATDPVDQTKTFKAYLIGNKVASFTFNPTASHYVTYGKSSSFQTVYDNYKNAMAAEEWAVQSVQFIFASATKMTFRSTFKYGTSTYNADYDFNMSVDYATGKTQFTKALPEGAGTNYTYGADSSVKPAFERFILPYLTNRVFVASFFPTAMTASDPDFGKFGGFYVDGTASNYFYGPIVLK